MITNSHDHHLSKLSGLKTELGKIYVHVVIQGFALSMISVFIPIFLLVQGYSLTQTFLFLFVEWTVFGLFAPFYGRFIHKTGLRQVILLRTPLAAIVLLGLSVLPSNIIVQQYFLVLAALKGISSSLYTMSIQSIFASNLGETGKGETTGKFMAFPKIAGLLGPFIGGYIILTLGFTTLFIVVLFLIVWSAIPLFFMKHTLNHPVFEMRHFKDYRREKKELMMLATYGFSGFVFTAVIPIAVFLHYNSVLSTGALMTGIALIHAVFTIHLGKFCDKHNAHKLVKLGGIARSIVFLILAFVYQSPAFIYLVLLGGFVDVLVVVPYETHLFSAAKRKNVLEFLAFKEFGLWFGRAALFLLMIIFSELSVGFFSGSLTSLMWLIY